MLPYFSKYHAGNVQVIKTLKPAVRPMFYEALIRLAVAGKFGRFTAGSRTAQDQHQIFLSGRPWLPGGYKGAVVTNADNMDSFHCWGVAVDFAPMKRNVFGWFVVDYRQEQEIAHLWHDVGIEHPWPSGGRSGSFVDDPHFHYTCGLSIGDFKVGKVPPAPTFTPVYASLPPDSQKVLVAMRDSLVAQKILPLF